MSEPVDTSKNRLTSSIQTIFGFISIIFIFGSCAYRMGYPYTCEQARQLENEAKRKVDEEFRKTEKGEHKSDAFIYSALDEQREVETKVRQKCSN